MKVVTSIRLDRDLLNHLKHLGINVSDYVNSLMLDDLKQQSYEDTKLKKVVDNSIKEERKSKILQEMKLIGALNNIAQRINDMAKEDPEVFTTLLKKNIELLQLEYDFDYSNDTKLLIKEMFKKLKDIQKEIAPNEKDLKLTNGKTKKKKKGL